VKSTAPVPAGTRLILGAAGLIFALSSGRVCAAPAVDFNRDIRPIFSDHCFACHGPDERTRKADLRLDSRATALARARSEDSIIVPGRPELSHLIERVTSDDPLEVMPPPKHGKPLSSEQVNLLVRWVEEGGEWRDHWAFRPPESPTPPSVQESGWPVQPIDSFLLARIEQAGLQPVPDADPATLLRRVTFDLTGLPPTPEEVDAFLADASPQAYERVVDRLLGSPHYGERMAVNWLDLARYADTSGYHFDGVRFMWLWRDWVIRAFNENKPFDTFTIEQLAGDLLPNPTRDQRVATGFVRNNMTNDEGGADPDEYLNKYVADRVNTFGNVWLGLTVACAECHDHKFDPLRTREYYQLYAFFHNVPEPGLDRIRTDNPPPRLPVPTVEQALEFVEADFRLRDAEKSLQDRSNELGETQEKWERETLADPPPTPDDSALLVRITFDDTLEVNTRDRALPAVRSPATNITTPSDGPRFIRDDEPQFVDGRLGRALKFDGRTHLDLGPLVTFERANAFSYGAWVRVADDGAILSWMGPGPARRGLDLFANDGRFEVHLAHHFPDDAIKVKTRRKFEGANWRHLLATYDGSGKAAGIKLYVDGQPRELEVEKDALQGSIAHPGPWRIGSREGDGFFTGQIDDVRIHDRELTGEDAQLLAFQGYLPILQQSRGQRTDDDRADLQRFYRENHAIDYLRAEKALAEARRGKNDLITAIPTTMVMEEMDPPRDTFLLVRGDFLTKGERVFPATPEFLPPIRPARIQNTPDRLTVAFAEVPPGPDWTPTRLDLAAWLFDPRHPLTARVTVNRYWAMFFGAGLLNTLNDFGAQGEWPSHPELLDWLAVRFRNGDPAATPPVAPWDIKALVRLIVTSRAYRQSPVVEPHKLERDPYNRLLARGPRLPLDAEFIRDNALAVAGLLNPKIGGPSVKPYQPPGIWDGTDSVFVQDHGEDLYRRGLYVFWRRSAHYPSFAAFDAPNREVCTFLRQRTQTPLQSLVLMNDPAFVECARGLAQRVLREEPGDLHRRLTRAFRLALGRQPASDEIDTLRRAYEQQLAGFQTDQKAAELLLQIGETPVPQDLDKVELSALTAVANVLLNLNETITK
jgi:mono/diheme cytochrome c family protein